MSLAVDRIHQQDCLAGLRKLTPGSVDLVFADPPFNIGYDYDEYDDRKKADRELNTRPRAILSTRTRRVSDTYTSLSRRFLGGYNLWM